MLRIVMREERKKEVQEYAGCCVCASLGEGMQPHA